jgi:hypothetical protein
MEATAPANLALGHGWSGKVHDEWILGVSLLQQGASQFGP